MSDENCRKCGGCCHITLPPFDKPLRQLPRNRRPPQELIDELQAHLNELSDNQCGDVMDIELGLLPTFTRIDGRPCFWLDSESKLCRHYEYRPWTCRDYFCEEALSDRQYAKGLVFEASSQLRDRFESWLQSRVEAELKGRSRADVHKWLKGEMNCPEADGLMGEFSKYLFEPKLQSDAQQPD